MTLWLDGKVLKASLPEYYEMKFEKLFQSKDYLPVSLGAIINSAIDTLLLAVR